MKFFLELHVSQHSKMKARKKEHAHISGLALYFQQYTEIQCGSNYHSPYGNGAILDNRPRVYKVGMSTEVNKLNVFFSKEILVANVPVIIFANIHLGEDLHTISSVLILAVALLYQHITIGDRHDRRFFCILFE